MNSYLVLPLVQVALSLGLLALVAIKGRRSNVRRLFLVFLASLGLWGLIIYGMRASPDTDHAIFWERLLLPLSFLIAVLFFHFVSKYTVTQTRNYFIPVLYTLVVLFIPLAATDLILKGMQIKSYGFAPVFGPLAPVLIFVSVSLAIGALTCLIKLYRKSHDSEVRIRTLYITIGSTASIVGMVFDLLPVLGLPLYPGFVIGNLVFCILTSIAILKHNLLDIHFVLRKTVAYVATLILFAVPFLAVLVIVEALLGRAPVWLHLIILSPLVMGFPLIWTSLQQRIARRFHRERYDYLQALHVFNEETQSLIDSGSLGNRMAEIIMKVVHASRAYVFLPSNTGDLVLESTGNETLSRLQLKASSALIKWLVRFKNPVSHNELVLIPQFVGNEKNILDELNIEIIVPMITATGNLSGLIALAEKLSDQRYSIEDRQFLSALASQMAVRFENMKLYNKAIQIRTELEALSRHLVQIQEDERRSIARELHDEISQSLALAKILLDRSLNSFGKGDSQLIQAQAMLREVINQVREMSLNLRPSILDDLGLLPALNWYLERYTLRTGVKVEFNHRWLNGKLGSDTAVAAYRIV